MAPVVKWIPEDAYKNLKVVVELDSDTDAQRIAEQELKRRHKSLGALKIVADRGLQVSRAPPLLKDTFHQNAWSRVFIDDQPFLL